MEQLHVELLVVVVVLILCSNLCVLFVRDHFCSGRERQTLVHEVEIREVELPPKVEVREVVKEVVREVALSPPERPVLPYAHSKDASSDARTRSQQSAMPSPPAAATPSPRPRMVWRAWRCCPVNGRA